MTGGETVALVSVKLRKTCLAEWRTGLIRCDSWHPYSGPKRFVALLSASAPL